MRKAEQAGTRRQSIAIGALEVLAQRGSHQLTHRVVDGHMGLPPGSTSYYFNSRAKLLAAAADALFEADKRDVLALGDDSDIDALLAIWAAPHARMRFLARLELFLEAARNPDFREYLAGMREYFLDAACKAMERRGEAEPKSAADAAIARFEGELLRAAVFGAPPGQPGGA